MNENNVNSNEPAQNTNIYTGSVMMGGNSPEPTVVPQPQPTPVPVPTEEAPTPEPVPAAPSGDVYTAQPVEPTPVPAVEPAPVATPLPQTEAQPTVMATPAAQPVQPEPAYTAPQSMPGFETSSQIGTTPPVNLEEEKGPKKKSNKLAFIVLIIALLAGVGYGTYYVLTKTDLLQKKNNIVINTKNLEFEIGEAIPENIIDYADVTGTDITNCFINKDSIDINNVGTYTYKITCGDVSKDGTVVIKANIEKMITLKTVYKNIEETVTPVEFFDNPNNSFNYDFVDSTTVTANLTTAGTYEVKLKVTSGEDFKEVTGKLVVLQYKNKGFVSCSKTSTNNNIETKETYKFAIADNTTYDFNSVATLESVFKFTNATDYLKYSDGYVTGTAITINDVTGIPVFDEESKTITILEDIDADSLKTKNGEDKYKTYQSIKAYYANTLNYSCIFENAN